MSERILILSNGRASFVHPDFQEAIIQKVADVVGERIRMLARVSELEGLPSPSLLALLGQVARDN